MRDADHRDVPADVLVIGGGPAGSTAAALLARAGRRVTLVDKARFPRYHIGESLLPSVLLFLDELGVRAEVEAAGFHKKLGQTFIWGRDDTPWRLDFRSLDAYAYSFFVERARFDALLLDNAARLGARVLQGTRVVSVRETGGRVTGAVVDDGSGPRELAARWVIDASGQTALLAHKRKLRRWMKGLKSLAVWQYYEGVGAAAPPEDDHIFTISFRDGWIWWIPLAPGTASVGIVTNDPGDDRAKTPRGLEELGAWVDGVARGTRLIKDWLAGARRTAGPYVQRDWSYRSTRFHGPGWLLAGDAACFIDPILSSGVNLAMSGGYLAALALHSALAEPAHEAHFVSYFQRAYRAIYDEQLASIKHFYAVGAQRESVYWKSKQLLAVDPGLEKDLAFLFINSGLARHVTAAAPHDVAGQARTLFASRLPDTGAAPSQPAYQPHGDATRPLVPPGELVIVEGEDRALFGLVQRGFRLHLEPYHGRERPAGGVALIELETRADQEPLGVARIEPLRPGAPRGTRHARGLAVTLRAYVRDERSERLLADAGAAMISVLEELPAPGKRPLPLATVARAVRRALRERPGDGWKIAAPPAIDRRDLAEQPISAEYARDGAAPVWVVARPRRSVEVVEAPFLRTRFVDLEHRGGDPDDAATRALLAHALAVVRTAVARKDRLASALAACEAALAAAPPGWRLVAIRRVATTC